MITGTFDFIASSGEMPNGSETEGITYTSLSANIRCTSSPLRNPVKWKRSAMPSFATRRMTWLSMSPLPAITKRTFLSRLSTLAAASTK